MEFEWATRLPNGNACKWDSENEARRAAIISQTFPDGEHALLSRAVGEWVEADVRQHDLGDDPDGDQYEQLEIALTQRAHVLIREARAERDAAVAVRDAITQAVEAEVATWQHETVEDCWYSCAATYGTDVENSCCDDRQENQPCNCGLDYRRDRLLAAVRAAVPKEEQR